MLRSTSRPVLLTLVLIALSFGCTNSQRNTGGDSSRTSQASAAQLSPDAADGLDFGDDAGRAAPANRPAPAQSQSPASRQTTARAPQPRDARGAQGAEPQGPVWSIVLNTFSGDGHEQMARRYLAELPALSPELAAARVRTTERGSMVIYGSWPEPDDPRAAAALDYVKTIKHGELPVFPRAFLSRIRATTAQQAQNPHSLMSLRRLHPNVDPLYSLQVGAWSDFESGQFSLQEVQRRAEAHAAELRAKGHQAYFHHDPNSGISVVTVGVFDRNAIDLESGLESSELRQLRRQFPHHLVNGEPLEELIDRRNPRRGTRIQEPRLVVVPRQ